MKKNISAYILCVSAYSIFGLSFLFSKTAMKYASPMVLLSVRFIIAFIVMNLILLTGKVKISLKGKPVWKLLLMGIIQPIIYYTCENYGIDLTSSAFAGLIIGLVPVVGLILGRIFLSEKISALQIICTVLSVFGVALTTVGGEVKFSVAGTILLIIAVFANCSFTVVSRSVADVFSPYERTYVMFALSSVFFTVVALIQSKSDISGTYGNLLNGEFLTSVLYLAVASTVCAFMFINYSLNHINVGTVSLLANFCTVISVPAGMLILKERFSVLQIIGVIVIIVSVFGASVRKNETAYDVK